MTLSFLAVGAPLLIAFRFVLCSGCFVLIVGVLAMTLLPGIPECLAWLL